MIKRTPYDSWRVGELPEGCKLCVKGQKLILFISGQCRRRCWYCPLPESRKGVDAVWANEHKLSSVNAVAEAIEEAKLSGAAGAGITGGNPLLVVDRVCKFAKALKKEFGKRFHLHIYLPTQDVTAAKLKKLAAAGIDEVRFHPNFMMQDLRSELSTVRLALRYKWKVGCEIPALPGKEAETAHFVDTFRGVIDFLNVNELEISVLNAPTLLGLGYMPRKNSAAVKSSAGTALRLLRYADKHTALRVHYCSARTKNIFQYKGRLRRRAQNIFRPYDLITKTASFWRAALYLPRLKPLFGYEKRTAALEQKKATKTRIIAKLRKLREKLMADFDIPSKLIEVDELRLRLLTSVEVAKKLSRQIKNRGLVPTLVEEIPAYDSQIIQLEYL